MNKTIELICKAPQTEVCRGPGLLVLTRTVNLSLGLVYNKHDAPEHSLEPHQRMSMLL